MKKTLLKLSLFSFLLFFCACQELITLPLEQTQRRVLIDGLICDQVGLQYIKVAYSLNYYETGKLPPITDADVVLLDDNGFLVEQYIYSNEDSVYFPSNSFSPIVGKQYKVQVKVGQELYEAKGKMTPTANLDSLYYLSKKQLELLGQNVFDGDYFMFVDGSLKTDSTEYFKLEVSVNDTLLNSRGDISNSILSSEFFGKEFSFLPVPGSFEAQDSVELALFSLSEDTYQYFVEFTNLLFNDGGVFSPPPVNPTSNITNTTNPDNYALGLIQFSAVLKKTIYIEED